jgi:hypothetical protein
MEFNIWITSIIDAPFPVSVVSAGGFMATSFWIYASSFHVRALRPPWLVRSAMLGTLSFFRVPT